MHKSSDKNECLICLKPRFVNQDLLGVLGRDLICGECRRLLKPSLKVQKKFDVTIISFYKFTHDASRIVVRYKDYGDTVLAPLFLFRYKEILNFLFKGYEVVPIPSIESHIERRGFYHLNLMLNDLDFKVNDCLVHQDSVAQKYRNQQERSEVNFHLKSIEMVKDKKIILFDDVMTTGSSIQSALRLLKDHCKKVVVIVLFK